MTLGDYQVNMLKVQKLLIDTFDIESRANDATAELAALAEKLGEIASAEND